MKKNFGKYEIVEMLPPNAVTVKEYADKAGISTSYVYKQFKQKKNKFKIVVFQTINFIIPTPTLVATKTNKKLFNPKEKAF